MKLIQINQPTNQPTNQPIKSNEPISNYQLCKRY